MENFHSAGQKKLISKLIDFIIRKIILWLRKFSQYWATEERKKFFIKIFFQKSDKTGWPQEKILETCVRFLCSCSTYLISSRKNSISQKKKEETGLNKRFFVSFVFVGVVVKETWHERNFCLPGAFKDRLRKRTCVNCCVIFLLRWFQVFI